jgi:hypothetical protein
MLNNNSLYLSHIQMAPPLFLHNCKESKQVVTYNILDFNSLNLK